MSQEFFDKEPVALAVALLGKVLRHRIDHSIHGRVWLAARIIETEAYYQCEKGSHSSLGYTEKRRAMFMSPGTIYMYYARGGDSLNFSARGDGNGVLIKAAYPVTDKVSPQWTLDVMRQLNPLGNGNRPEARLCNGQTLLCKSLGLKVTEWNQHALNPRRLRLEDTGYEPGTYVQCRRLGIPSGRDEHLPYRFVDAQYARYATSNPLTRRNWVAGEDYHLRQREAGEGASTPA